MSNGIANELVHKDRGLKDMSVSDLRILASDLQGAIATARWMHMHAMADKMEAMMEPVVKELQSRQQLLPRGPRSPYSSSENR